MRRLSLPARSDLLWGLGAFVLLQASLALAIERWLPELRDPYVGYRLKRLTSRLTGQGPRPLTVVALGSSRVQDGFQASALERYLTDQSGRPTVVFNFGIPGAGPVTNLLNFKRLRREGIKPDLLLVEAVPSFFGKGAWEREFITGNRLWPGEAGGLARYRLAADELRREWWEAAAVPCYWHRFKIMSRLAPAFLAGPVRQDWAFHIDRSGWCEPIVRSVNVEARRLRSEAAIREHGSVLRNFEFDESSCRAFRDLLASCRKQGIATAVLWMPEGSTFRALYSGHLPTIRAFLDHVGRDYHAPIICARDWIGDSGFSDNHHMLLEGAAEFTERLGREVLLPLLETAHSSRYSGRTETPLNHE